MLQVIDLNGSARACARSCGTRRRPAQEAGQAAQAGRELSSSPAPVRNGDPRAGAGDPARAAPLVRSTAAASRPRPHDLYRRVINRNNRLKPPDGAARARHHRAQREAHAAGVGRRAVRQRRSRRVIPAPTSPLKSLSDMLRASRAASAEPARQARRLLGAARSSWSARSSSCSSAACPRRWRSSCSSRSSPRLQTTAWPTPSRPPSAWSRRNGGGVDILEEVIREHPVLPQPRADAHASASRPSSRC